MSQEELTNMIRKAVQDSPEDVVPPAKAARPPRGVADVAITAIISIAAVSITAVVIVALALRAL